MSYFPGPGCSTFKGQALWRTGSLLNHEGDTSIETPDEAGDVIDLGGTGTSRNQGIEEDKTFHIITTLSFITCLCTFHQISV